MASSMPSTSTSGSSRISATLSSSPSWIATIRACMFLSLSDTRRPRYRLTRHPVDIAIDLDVGVLAVGAELSQIVLQAALQVTDLLVVAARLGDTPFHQKAAFRIGHRIVFAQFLSQLSVFLEYGRALLLALLHARRV